MIKRKRSTVPARRRSAHDKNWIQGAIRKPGALHEQLDVPEGKAIPKTKLAKAASKPGKLGRRARLARTLAGLRKRSHRRMSKTEKSVAEALGASK
jgi:hypothetical protein